STQYLRSYVAALYPELLWKDTELREQGIVKLDAPPDHHIFIKVVPYRSGYDLRKAQLLENATRTKQALGEGSFLDVSRDMYLAGENQAAFRKAMKDGTGQKMWYINVISSDPRFKKM